MLKEIYYYFLIKKSNLFDEEYYLLHNPDVRHMDINPLLHYIKFGWVEGRNPGPIFDNNWYLQNYNDVKNAKINPLVHFLKSGMKEGRLPHKNANQSGLVLKSRVFRIQKLFNKSNKNINDYFLQGDATFDENRETILVVSHEAELTGAPVLAWNIAKNFSQKYNVISLFLRGGEIIDSFSNVSIQLIDLNLPSFQLDGELAERIIEKLLNNYNVKFAIINSIVSRGILPALSKNYIPTLHLIHEFAAYIKPQNAFLNAALWANLTIFSTSMTYENALLVHPELREHSNAIIPQGKCEIPNIDNDSDQVVQDNSELIKIVDKRKTSSNSIIVLGVGYVQIRKGVDLFIACASKTIQNIKDRDIHFLWIGDGYDPDLDIGYSSFLSEQISRSDLKDKVSIIKSTRNIELAYEASDMLLISSRLDPLPNVAIDAMLHKLPVLCFNKATGIAEILINNDLKNECIAPYMDIETMSNKIKNLAESKTLREKVGEQLQQLAFENFEMTKYINKLENAGLELVSRVKQEKKDVATIVKADIARMDFYPTAIQNKSEAIKHYVRTWATGIGRKKLFPGFHPGVYLENFPEIKNIQDPLAHYIQAAEPDGPWKYEIITETNKSPQAAIEEDVALHIHVYYPELLPEILNRLDQNQIRPDLFFSVPNTAINNIVSEMTGDYRSQVKKIATVPNRGRDIGPFLTDFSSALSQNYEIVGHVHTKKTSGFDEEIIVKWRNFLLENLIGGTYKMADNIINQMLNDTTIGLVFPDNPDIIGWDKNLPFARPLAEKLGIEQLPKYFNFPVGTMFWGRAKALQPLFDLGLKYEDYPTEPLPYDGSMLHALERILPFVVKKMGYKNVLTNVKGITR